VFLDLKQKAFIFISFIQFGEIHGITDLAKICPFEFSYYPVLTDSIETDKWGMYTPPPSTESTNLIKMALYRI
jgi:hypothetical protein